MKNQFLLDKRHIVTLLIRANELKRQRNYQEALTVYLKLYKRIGEDVDLITMIAFCNLALNNFKEAVDWGEKAISLAPDNEHLHIDLGEYCSIGLNDYERAVRKYRQAIELNPNSVRALVGVASLYGVPEKVVALDEAIICLEPATELEPDDPNHHFRLGKFYHEANRLLERDREWNKALLCSYALDPGPTNKVKVVLNTNDVWQKIKSQFSSDKRHITTLLIRANELKRQRNYQEALTVYLKLYKRIGEDVDLITMIAFCNLALNNFKEAVGWGEKAISLAPDNEHLHIDLGEYCSIGLNDYERAVRKYRQAIELNPNSVRALVGVASLYGVPEKVVALDEAIICLEPATELEPDDPNHHFRLGKFYHEANRLLERDREWNKALLCSYALDPGPVDIIKAVLNINDA